MYKGGIPELIVSTSCRFLHVSSECFHVSCNECFHVQFHVVSAFMVLFTRNKFLIIPM